MTQYYFFGNVQLQSNPNDLPSKLQQERNREKIVEKKYLPHIYGKKIVTHITMQNHRPAIFLT